MRDSNRSNTAHRTLQVQRHFTKHAPGSVLISYGDTKVLCTASIEDGVPRFLKDSGEGWLTAEYSVLPSSTSPRASREVNKGKQSGRTNEIQRLIGRSLRQAIDLTILGEKTIYIDADVIQADGGTRTAAVTGGMIALRDAVHHLLESKKIRQNPLKDFIAAVSVGIVNDQVLVDLCYEEDFKAEVDMNIVMTETGRFIEVQGTAESKPFSPEQLTQMLEASKHAIQSIISQVKSV